MSQPQTFVVRTSDGAEFELNAVEVVNWFEENKLSGDDLVFLKRDAPPKPLRKLVRELVFTSFRETSEAAQSASFEDEEKQQLYRVAFEKAPDGVIITDLAARILDVNKSFVEMLGYEWPSEKEYFIGKAIGEVTCGPDVFDRSEERTQCNDVLAGTRQMISCNHFWVGKDGRPCETHLTVAITKTPDGLPSQWVAHTIDLSERKRLEAELTKQERLASLGRVASGVAHDFNNLLGIIRGSLDLISATDGLDSEVTENISAAREASNMASRLTQQLMAFSRDGIVPLGKINLQKEIFRLKSILSKSLPSRIKLDVVPAPPEDRLSRFGTMEGNQVLIEQVIVNLVTNSKKAYSEDDSGTITISLIQSENDGTAGVRIEDDGCGMPEDVMEKAFDPFFTTRLNRGGTGLGLSTVHGIVTRFQGSIKLESELGKGTVFTISFPVDLSKTFEEEEEAAAAPTKEHKLVSSLSSASTTMTARSDDTCSECSASDTARPNDDEEEEEDGGAIESPGKGSASPSMEKENRRASSPNLVSFGSDDSGSESNSSRESQAKTLTTMAGKKNSGGQKMILRPSSKEDVLAGDTPFEPSDFHVLVVDDQPAILRIVERVLTRAGYRITTANCVQNAVETLENAFNQNPDSNTFDLLLSDVLMPDGNGTEVAKKAVSLYPSIPVLYMTGYSANALEEDNSIMLHAIIKPFSPKDLLRRIKGMLSHLNGTAAV